MPFCADTLIVTGSGADPLLGLRVYEHESVAQLPSNCKLKLVGLFEELSVCVAEAVLGAIHVESHCKLDGSDAPDRSMIYDPYGMAL